MATRNKIFIPENIYFITFTILGWNKIFIDDKYINLVYKWFDYMKDNYGNKIHGYVVMPNHLHCLIYITSKSPILPKLIQNAKRFLAYQIIDLLEQDDNKKLLAFFKANARTQFGAKHKVFENNYDSLLIESEKFFIEKLDYIHNNPCQKKWQLVENSEDYKHSSASNYILDCGVYNIDLINLY